jgi:hypothetical protein
MAPALLKQRPGPNHQAYAAEPRNRRSGADDILRMS